MRRTGDPYLPRQMAFLLDLAPRGVCRAGRVAVTPVGSYSAFSPFPDKSGSLFSAALSVASLLLAVSQPSALWSPDFPLKDQRLEVLLFHKVKELVLFVFIGCSFRSCMSVAGNEYALAVRADFDSDCAENHVVKFRRKSHVAAEADSVLGHGDRFTVR